MKEEPEDEQKREDSVDEEMFMGYRDSATTERLLPRSNNMKRKKINKE